MIWLGLVFALLGVLLMLLSSGKLLLVGIVLGATGGTIVLIWGARHYDPRHPPWRS